MKQIQYDGFELEHFDNAKSFRNYQVSLIKKYLKGNFLEVGAGKGGLALQYYKNLDKLTLIEPDKKLFRILKNKFDKKNTKIFNKFIKDINDKFDTIIYFDVIEHIKNDLLEIKNASKKLKKNGHLILNVPAFQFFYSDFDKSVGHFKRYNKKDFYKLSKKSGLRLEKIYYYDSIGYILLLISKIFSFKQTNLKNKVFFWNMLIPISKILDKLIFNCIGKSLLCVFVKG